MPGSNSIHDLSFMLEAIPKACQGQLRHRIIETLLNFISETVDVNTLFWLCRSLSFIYRELKEDNTYDQRHARTGLKRAQCNMWNKAIPLLFEKIGLNCSST